VIGFLCAVVLFFGEGGWVGGGGGGGGGGGVISRVCFDAAETQEASACAEDRSLVL